MNKLDILKEVLFMLLKIAAFFVYWCFTLAVFSLILVNVWRVTWEQLLTLAIVLTVLTTVVHIVGKLRKRK
ncbi:MAG: hypothetical protein E7291_06180 [Lachnospiraceae bacterium]|nr:hypothetical protein [Lachnospiraceae bacterium]